MRVRGRWGFETGVKISGVVYISFLSLSLSLSLSLCKKMKTNSNTIPTSRPKIVREIFVVRSLCSIICFFF